MSENFFVDYKKFIVEPKDKNRTIEVYDPKNFAAHYILTLSLFNSRLVTWRDAGKYDIDVEKSIKTVVSEFNRKQQNGLYHLELLELDKFKNYFVLALSTKLKFKPEEENDRISYMIDKMLTNPFYVGQNWFNIIGEKGRVERKLFCCSFKKYSASNDEKYEKINEIIPKSGEIKLIKSLPKRDIL
jgi:hypothetical protein